ncbi:MAG: 1,4-alpha-glucan branching protein GlgB [Oligoflexus sp.]
MNLEERGREPAVAKMLKDRDGRSAQNFEHEWFQDFDCYLFKEGTHQRLYDKLGAHLCRFRGVEGVRFGVWAPTASEVYVAGDFNEWDPFRNQLEFDSAAGIWQTFVADARADQEYKFLIKTSYQNQYIWKSDPFGRFFRNNNQEHNVTIWQTKHAWKDEDWLQERVEKQSLDQPINIYELHVGSWRRKKTQNGWGFLSYRDLAETLPDFLKQMNYTHVELMPIMEHPFYGSWGYQVTGFFAPTHRYGTPDDLKFLIDTLHQAGIGVILDWVPSHFPGDSFALYDFDGSHLFEYSDPRKGYHQDWGSYIFDYGRPEVRSFLISNALFWLEEFHIDGLRVDAVASMLYLDYSRREGEWVPNQYGGRENLEAISFLKQLNQTIHQRFSDVLTIAEESTAWPQVSRPVDQGGLGFSMKWDMGWMHDTLKYFSQEPVYRQFHQHQLTFRSVYSFHENFVLSLSHDEVVHGKYSLINKMPGDRWQKFANLRNLYAYMMSQPGKKLLFMGSEFGQSKEWNHDSSLDWSEAEQPENNALMRFVRELNGLYLKAPAFHESDFSTAGFAWVDTNDHTNSIISYLRRTVDQKQTILCVFNLTPMIRRNYRIGVPYDGTWYEILNTDALEYGGSGVGNYGSRQATPVPFHGHWHSLNLVLPPLSAVFFSMEMASYDKSKSI